MSKAADGARRHAGVPRAARRGEPSTDPAFIKARGRLSERARRGRRHDRGALRRSVGHPRHGCRGGAPGRARSRDHLATRSRRATPRPRRRRRGGAGPGVARHARPLQAAQPRPRATGPPTSATSSRGMSSTCAPASSRRRHIPARPPSRSRRIFTELIPEYAATADGARPACARAVLRARRPERRARGAAAGAGPPAVLGDERRLPGLLRLGNRSQGDAPATSSAASCRGAATRGAR